MVIVSLNGTREGNWRGLRRFIVHKVNASLSLTRINTLNIKVKENKQRMMKLNGKGLAQPASSMFIQSPVPQREGRRGGEEEGRIGKLFNVCNLNDTVLTRLLLQVIIFSHISSYPPPPLNMYCADWLGWSLK